MSRLDISRLRRNRAIYLKLGFVLSLAFVTYAFTVEIDHIDYTDGFVAPIDLPDIMQVLPRLKPERPPVPPPPPELQKIEPDLLEDTPEFVEEPIPLDIPVAVTENPPLENYEPVAMVAPPTKKPELPKDEIIPDIDIDKTWDFVDEMPRFPGCEAEEMSKSDKKMCADRALMKFIGDRVKYPQMAKEVGMEGVVYVEFVIDKNGKPGEFEIIRSPGKLLSDEAIRVLRQMPNWKPGKQRLRPVKVRYRLPMKFQYL